MTSLDPHVSATGHDSRHSGAPDRTSDKQPYPCKRRARLNLVLALLTAGTAAWAGWATTRAYGDALNSDIRSYFGFFRASVLYAAGHGLGVADCEDDAFPELQAFLQNELSEIKPEAYPAACDRPYPQDPFFLSHYYLVYYVGIVFRLFGVSIASFYIACVLLHVVAVLAVYGIFRLAMGPFPAALGALATALSPAYLLVLPSLRDFGKAPFILLTVLILGDLLKRKNTPGHLLFRAVLLGVLLGLGYGFRQDLAVCLPPALLIVAAGARLETPRPWRVRCAACAMLILCFLVVAAPVIGGTRHVGGGVMAHSLFQGFMKSAEDNADFGSISYDLGYYSFDTPVIAAINSHARRAGGVYPVVHLSPEYAMAGNRMFRDVLDAFPADVAGRALMVAAHAHAIPADPYIDRMLAVPPYRAFPDNAIHHFHRLHQGLAGHLAQYGLLYALAVLAMIAAESYRIALLVLFLGLYLGAYPSVLFEFRHYFHLAVIPWFFFGAALSAAAKALSFVAGGRQDKTPAPQRWRNATMRCVRGLAFVVVAILCLSLPLHVLRSLQSRRMATRADSLAASALTPIPVSVEQDTGKVRVHLERSVADMQGALPLAHGHTADALLAAKFSDAPRTIQFLLENTNPLFARPCLARLDSGGTYFFPVHDFGWDPEASFQGIEFAADDFPFFEGLYQVESADDLPLWPFVFVPEERRFFRAFKRGGLDRSLRMRVAEIRGGFGLWPERALSAYREMVPDYPKDDTVMKRALRHGARAEESALIALWQDIGVYMPGMRHKASLWMAETAVRKTADGDYIEAISLYEKALVILPEERWRQVHIGEVQERMGNREGAIATYKEVLRHAPESPYTAEQLNRLLLMEPGSGEALEFWHDLAQEHPDAALPWRYLGQAYESAGEMKKAEECQAKAETIARDAH